MGMIFKTTKMEDAARVLYHHSKSPLIRVGYMLENPIRLRTYLLQDCDAYIGRNGSGGTAGAAMQRQVALWKQNGGMLITYSPNFKADNYDAQLYAEAPMSLHRINHVPAVIYRPPSWENHKRAVTRLYPDTPVCKRFFAHVKGVGIDEAQTEIFKFLGYDAKHVAATTDAELVAHFGMKMRYLYRIRNAMLATERAKKFISVWPMIARCEPEDRTLMDVYLHITMQPKLNGVHMIVDSALFKAAQFWRRQVRALERKGCITTMERIGFYHTRGVKPDYARIKDFHVKAHERMAGVIAAMLKAPTFSLAAWKRYRREAEYQASPPPPPVARVLPADVAHWSDTVG